MTEMNCKEIIESQSDFGAEPFMKLFDSDGDDYKKAACV
jgi:hypothetical protein